MEQRRKWYVATLLGVLFSSCISSEQPLSRPEDADRDDRLLGNWIVPKTDKEPEHLLKIVPCDGKDGPVGMLKFVSREEPKDPNDEPGHAFLTHLDGKWYLNCVISDDKPFKYGESKVKGYWIMEYRIEGDELQFLFPDTSFITAQIDAGKIRGKDGSLTDTPEKIRAWLVANEAKIYHNDKPLLTWKRDK